MKISFKGR